MGRSLSGHSQLWGFIWHTAAGFFGNRLLCANRYVHSLLCAW